MAKRPEDRYPDCRALADDLRRWLDGDPVHARRLGLLERARRWSRREPVLASTLLVALLALLAAVLVPLTTAVRLAAAVHSRERAAEQWRQSIEEAEQAAREADLQQRRARAEADHAREAADLFTREARLAQDARAEAARLAARAEKARAEVEGRKGDLLPLQYAADILLASEDLRDGFPERAAERLRRLDSVEEKLLPRGLEWRLLTGLLREAPPVVRIPGVSKLRKVRSLPSPGKEWRFETEHGLLIVPYDNVAEARVTAEEARDGAGFPLRSADGKVLVSALGRDRLRVQRKGDVRIEPADLTGFDLPPLQGLISARGKRVVTHHRIPLESDTLWVWDAEAGKLLRKIMLGEAGRFQLALSPAGDSLAVVKEGGRACLLWREPDWDAPRELAHPGTVQEVEFSPDGSLLKTLSAGQLTLWETATGARRLQLALGQLGSFALRPDWSLLACSDGKRAAVWDVASGREAFPLTSAPPYPFLQFSSDGQTLFVSEEKGVGAVQVWSLKEGKQLLQVPRRQSEFWFAGGEGEATTLITLPLLRDSFRLWRVRPGESVGPILLDRPRLLHVAVSPDGDRLLFLHGDGVVQARQRSRLRSPLLGEEGRPVAALAASADGSTLLAAKEDLAAWDVSRGSRKESHALGQPARLLACRAGEKLCVALVDAGGVLRLREGGRQLWEARADGVSCLAFSVEGTSLVLGYGDGGVRLRERLTGKETILLSAGGRACRAVALSRDERRLAMARESGVEVLGPGSTRDTVLLPAGKVRCLAWSPDGLTLVSGDEDGRVRLWQAATGQELLTLEPRLGAVTALAVDREGGLLAAGGAGGLVRFWPAPRP
jgi:WD40 repeat protein